MPYDPTRDQYPSITRVEEQATIMEPVVPSDTDDFSVYPKALYIGVTGNLTVIPLRASTDAGVLISNHPVGYLRGRVRRVLATGTTASGIVAFRD